MNPSRNLRSNASVAMRKSLRVAQNRPKRSGFATKRNQQMGVKRARSSSELNVKPEQKRRAVFADLTNNPKPSESYPSKKKPVICELTEAKDEEAELPTPKTDTSTLLEPLQELSIAQLSLALEPVAIASKADQLPSLEETINWYEFDEHLSGNAIWASEYAKDIFAYYHTCEAVSVVPDYMSEIQTDVTPEMRSILIEWMVEVQGNFELHHETLYLAVKLLDKYLSKVSVRRSILQLVGTAAMFVAAKFDETFLPPSDDFLYVCDNAYDLDSLFKMERSILASVDFYLGFPLSYRFLRRYSNVSRQTTKTLTLARYVLEMTLLDYQFCKEKESLKAATCLWLALKMTGSCWDAMLTFHSGYNESDLIELAVELNSMLLDPCYPCYEIIKKYSHSVFLEVAQIPKLSMEDIKL